MKKGIPTLTAKLSAECIGTFILSFTVINCLQAKSDIAALSIASSLMIGVYCTGSVSGGHLNPAVTLGLFLAGKLGGPGGSMPAVEAVLYWVAQLAGAAIAALTGTFMWTTDMGGSAGTHAAGMMEYTSGTLGSPAGFDAWKVFGGETIYTMMLVFVVLNVATCNDMPSGNSYFGLAIGFVILAAVSAEGNVSGTCLNPAVTFGILIMNFSKNIGQIPVYWGAQVVGSILAVVFFYGCRAHLFKGGNLVVSLGSKLLAEFLGTFYLVITVYQVVVQSAFAPVVAVVGIASSLMCMIYALWNVSGGNFNPAVSLGLLITKNLSAKDFAFYVVVQLFGGLVAVGLGALIQPQGHVALAAGGGHANAMAHGSMAAVSAAEVFYTALLVFAVLNSAVRDAPNNYFALIIGFSIVVGGVAVGSLSGGAFNPAVSLSLFFAGLFQTKHAVSSAALLYPVSELVGGSLAAAAFMLISQTKDEGDYFESSDSESN